MRYISARIRFGASVAVNVEKFEVAAKMLRLRRKMPASARKYMVKGILE